MTTHDTLMALADTYVMTYHPTGGYKEARAALSAAIAEVLAERDQWESLADKSKGIIDALIAERDSLREQVRREQLYVQDLAKDAARYRWLRDQLYCGDVDVGEAYLTMRTVGSCPTEEQFDAAIDSAMKGTPT